MRMQRVIGAALMMMMMMVASPAMAAGDNAMKVCGARYQAGKAGKTLPVGQTWAQFLSQCRASMTAAPVSTAARASKAVSPAQVAMRTRQQACAKQWQADKASGKIAAGQTWPKYWSACNARMKG